MLRATLRAPRSAGLLRSQRALNGVQWQLVRYYADAKTPDKTVLPGSQSADAPRPGSLGMPPTVTASPIAPAAGPDIPPSAVPKVPPPPELVQSQTLPPRPPTSAPPPPPPPPPPPSPPKPKRSWTRRLLWLMILSGTAYGAAVYYALVNDNFHDFFTEYIPFGEEVVLYFEERELRRRFSDRSGSTPSRLQPQPRGENKLTISSKSGVSAKVAKPDAAEKSAKGTTTAVGAQAQKKDAAADQAKSPAPPDTSKSSSAAAATVSTPAAKPSPPSSSTSQPVTRIDPIAMDNANDPVMQRLAKILNDIIAVVNADAAGSKYSTAMTKAKDELSKISKDIVGLKATETKSAAEALKEKEGEFDQSARELVKRIEAEMQEQELRWKEEYEAERQRLAQIYDEKLRAELSAAQRVADQRLQNKLLERDLQLQEDFTKSIKDRIDTERSGRLGKLNELSSSVDELQHLTSQWNAVVDSNLQTQHLIVAVEAVRSILEHADRPTPFVHELAALKEIANEDAVVNAAIASIPPTAYQRGIPTAAQLIDRFRRVAAEVRKAALLPADAGVASHLASLALSRVMFQKKGLAPGDDVESVLTRTETFLEEGNLDEAAREINGLTGWAKVLCRDWLGDCRAVLETRQALDVIATEARLQSLLVE